MGLATTAAIGGVAGVVGWGVEIPLDGLKTRYQAFKVSSVHCSVQCAVQCTV